MYVVGSGLVKGIDTAPIDPLPDAEVRQLVVGGRAPSELGGMETLLTGMTHQGRQGVGEAEAVGQHDIIAAAHAELLLVEAIGIEHAVQDALGRGHHHIAGIDGHSADVPLPALDVAFQLLELRRVVLLHPHVLDGALVVEAEVGILVHERHVVHQRVLHILRDGGLYVPVPLCVEMGVRDEEEGLVVLRLAKGGTT